MPPPSRRTPVARLPERSMEKNTLEHFERFCYSLKLEDTHEPFRLRDWQLAKLADFFDDELDALEHLWLEPTGMGKSTLLGAVGLHHGTYVRENPNVFVLGGLGGHGRNTLDAAAGFVRRSPVLSQWWEAQEYGMGRLKCLIDAGSIKVSSAGRRVGGRGGSSQEGTAPTLILVEETHRHEDNGAAIRTLTSKVQKRSTAGLSVRIVHATTAGDTLDSPLGRMVERATDVENGAKVQADLRPGEYYRRAIDADGDLVMHEWALPDAIVAPDKNASRDEIDAYLREVKKANPADFITLRNLRRMWKAGSAEPWVFLRQSANQWVTQDFAAIDKGGWYGGLKKGLAIPANAKGVYIGLDTATKWDTTAICPVWVDPETGRPRTAGSVIHKSRQAGTQRRMRDVIDVLQVMRARWPDMRIVFDRNYGGGLIAEQFEEDHGLTVIDHGQGTPFELASMLFGELVDQHGFDHDGNEEVTSHVLAAVARRSRYGRRWRVEKPRDGRPIDACAALAMATNMAVNPPEVERTINIADYRIEPL